MIYDRHTCYRNPDVHMETDEVAVPKPPEPSGGETSSNGEPQAAAAESNGAESVEKMEAESEVTPAEEKKAEVPPEAEKEELVDNCYW